MGRTRILLFMGLAAPVIMAPPVWAAAKAELHSDVPVSAAAQPSGGLLDAALTAMRARDRFAAPNTELAAWEAFLAQVIASPDKTDHLLADAYRGLAIARYYAKDHAGGFAAIEQAQDLIARMDAPPAIESELLSYGALLLIDLKRPEEALSYAQRAQAAAQARGNAGRGDLALSYNAQGLLAFSGNDLPEAERLFCRARDLTLEVLAPSDPMITTNAVTCATIKYFLERSDTITAARTASDHAMANLPPDHPRMGLVLNNSYAVLVRLGRYLEAEPLVRRHLALERSIHAGAVDDVYDPLSMLARVLALRGQMEEAEVLARAAADMAMAMNTGSQPYKPGTALVTLGQYIGKRGRAEEAAAVISRGVERLRADLEPDDTNIGSGLAALADQTSRLGQPAEALSLIGQALAILEAKLPPDHSEVLAARLVEARVLAQLGGAVTALPRARAAAQTLSDRLFGLTSKETERVSLSLVLPDALANYLDVALAAQSEEDMVGAAQMRLLSELAVTDVRIAAGASARNPELVAALRAMNDSQTRTEILGTQLSQAQAEGRPDAALLSQQLATARIAAAAAQAALEEEFPDYVTVMRPRIASLTALQSSLQADQLLVLPISLPGRAVSLGITRDRIITGESAIGAQDVAALAARMRQTSEQVGDFDAEAASALFGVVFPGPLKQALADAGEVLFPASGYLSRIAPGSLLSSPLGDPADLPSAQWLARNHAVRIVGNLAQIAPASPYGLAASADASANVQFLGVGAPAGSDFETERGDAPATRSGYQSAIAGLAPLPGAKDELDAIGAVLAPAGGATILTGTLASEAGLRALNLGAYTVLAFATHGLVSGEVPGLVEPALVLTPGDGAADTGADQLANDGLLTASEIAILPLNADWVILSACNSGSGGDGSAPAFSGLARAFRQAGARALMLSHWRVRDDAAQRLSVATVRGTAQGLGRAEALRQAQLSLMADRNVPGSAHPAIWAPFVIVEN